MKAAIVTSNGPSMREIDYSLLPKITMFLDVMNFIMKESIL
ncbi:hypothetical protein ACMCRY_000178 [Campylobacter coli]